MDVDPVKAKRYRDRAAQVRAEAETMTGQQGKQTLLDIATSYERLADRLEGRAQR